MDNRGQRFSTICGEAIVEEIASRSREIGVNESESYQDGSSERGNFQYRQNYQNYQPWNYQLYSMEPRNLIVFA